MKDFSQLEKEIGVIFKNKELLKQAFCHRSYLNEKPDFPGENNERLEFLGDAVLELIVTEHLFKNYDNPEGELTGWRAALVNTSSLSEASAELNFGEYLLLSRGEKKDTGRARQYLLANAFEAFLGALYIDQGYDKCKEFVTTHLISKLPSVLKENSWQDAKSQFQELTQERMRITPSYKILRQWGPDHARHFESGVYLGKDLIAKGEGLSKQEAEEDAAKKAIAKKIC